MPHAVWGRHCPWSVAVEASKILQQEVLHGQRVVAVNAASAYHAGGGFQTGGRHALEEAMCAGPSWNFEGKSLRFSAEGWMIVGWLQFPNGLN